MRTPSRFLIRLGAALLALTSIGSCSDASSGAVIVIDAELCELNDPSGNSVEWTKIVVTVNGTETFCATLDPEGAPADCQEIGQGSFPLTLPVQSESGMGTFPVQIELFAAAGDSDPIVCETTDVAIVPERVNWYYTVLLRACGTDGACTPGVMEPMPGWSSIDDVLRELTGPAVECVEPEPPPALPIERVAAGGEHACLIDAMSRLYCWGSNEASQLSLSERVSTRPRLIRTTAGQLVRDVSLGRSHSCALISGPQAGVYCWGLNDNHQLGRGGEVGDVLGNPDRRPVLMVNNAEEISVGESHGCLRAIDGTVRCWGHNEHGSVDGNDNGTSPRSAATPITLPGLAVWVTANGRVGSGHHSCALIEDGTVTCWGQDDQGQLGYPDDLEMPTVPHGPGMVTGLPNPIVQVAAGGLDTCATDDGGALYCWGRNQPPGTLGVSTMSQIRVPTANVVVTPETVLAPPTVMDAPPLPTLGSGDQYHCFINAAGLPFCFGIDEDSGRLGARVANSVAPVAVPMPAALAGVTFQSIAVGDKFVCALPTGMDNMPICWGDNAKGQRATLDTNDYDEARQVARCN